MLREPFEAQSGQEEAAPEGITATRSVESAGGERHSELLQNLRRLAYSSSLRESAEQLLQEVTQACTGEGVTATLVAPHLKRPGIRIDLSPTTSLQQEIYEECQRILDTQLTSYLFSRKRNSPPDLDDVVFRFTGGLRLTPELFQRAGFFIFEGVHTLPSHMNEKDIEEAESQYLHRDGVSGEGIVSLRFTGGVPRLAQTTVGDTDEIVSVLSTSLSQRPAMAPYILPHRRKVDFYREKIQPLLTKFQVDSKEVKVQPVPKDISALLGSINLDWNKDVLKSLSVLQRLGVQFSPEDFLPYLKKGFVSPDASDYRVLHELVSSVTHRVSYVPGTWLLLDNSMRHGRFCSQPDTPVSQSIQWTRFFYDGGKFYPRRPVY